MYKENPKLKTKPKPLMQGLHDDTATLEFLDEYRRRLLCQPLQFVGWLLLLLLLVLLLLMVLLLLLLLIMLFVSPTLLIILLLLVSPTTTRPSRMIPQLDENPPFILLTREL